MIPVTCSCGKTLRAKDELAGRRVKCPACAEPLTIPSSDVDEDDDFSDPWDDDSEPVQAPAPRARAGSSSGTKKSAKGKGKSSGKPFQLTWRRVLAIPVMLLGGAILLFGAYAIITGERFRVAPFFFAAAMISVGWTWLQDKTTQGSKLGSKSLTKDRRD